MSGSVILLYHELGQVSSLIFIISAPKGPYRRYFFMAQVTKDTRIGELLEIDADVAPILLSIGMHCLGCPASQMETIEEAAAVHGVDADELVKALNEKISG